MKDNVFDVHEFSMDYGECNYLVIYGRHINGGFIAIPNWNICVEASAQSLWKDVTYNKLVLAGQKGMKQAAEAIARSIREHYASYLKSLTVSGQGIWQHFGPSGRYVKDGEVIATYDSIGHGQEYYFSMLGEQRLEMVRSDDEHIAEIAEKKYEEACKKNSMEQSHAPIFDDSVTVSRGKKI